MDIIDGNLDIHGESLEGVPLRGKPAAILIIHRCPICSTVCKSEEDIQRHIFAHHRSQYAYLKVNDLVVTTECNIDDNLYRLEVCYFGPGDITGTWLIGGKKGRFSVANNGKIDIFPLIKDHLHHSKSFNELKVTLNGEGEGLTFLITGITARTIDYEQINQVYLNFQSQYIDSPESFDWVPFKQELHKARKNNLESIYLAALFDYLFSLDLECQGEYARCYRLLEKSFTDLRRFSSLLSHIVRTTIALKLNWFYMLQDNPRESLFYPSGLFFNYRYRELLKVKPIINKFDPTNGVFVDDFHFLYLQSISSYFQQTEELAELIDKLESHPLKNANTSNAEKFELLAGRYFRQKGDLRAARKAYGSLCYHPFFGPEVEEI